MTKEKKMSIEIDVTKKERNGSRSNRKGAERDRRK